MVVESILWVFSPGGMVVRRTVSKSLADVAAQENESFESLLKRFNKRVQQEGVLSELRRREFYEKPSIKRKRKEATKRRKSSRPPRRS